MDALQYISLSFRSLDQSFEASLCQNHPLNTQSSQLLVSSSSLYFDGSLLERTSSSPKRYFSASLIRHRIAKLTLHHSHIDTIALWNNHTHSLSTPSPVLSKDN
jgi:hypothetical protein